MSRATLEKSPDEVAAMFDGVAKNYDLTNGVLSMGLDRTWRTAVRDSLKLQPGQRVLDLAAGTGTSSVAFGASGVDVLACDFSLGMLKVGAQRLGGARTAQGRGSVAFVAGDGLRLPLATASVDAATISFGLRNVADTDACLRELRRVVRPGGRLVVCEFSRPVFAPFRRVYTDYLMRALPPIARTVSSNPDAYVYLAESIRAWPDQAALAVKLQEAGWADVAWRDLTGGIVALHRGVNPV